MFATTFRLLMWVIYKIIRGKVTLNTNYKLYSGFTRRCGGVRPLAKFSGKNLKSGTKVKIYLPLDFWRKLRTWNFSLKIVFKEITFIILTHDNVFPNINIQYIHTENFSFGPPFYILMKIRQKSWKILIKKKLLKFWRW
jgi:hypothetical protein